VLEFAANARAVYEISDAVRRRQIIQTVSSNWKIEGKKCVYSAKQPFSLVERSSRNRDWQACLSEVRTWVTRNFANFSLPEIETAQAAHSVT
jgi:hypothetical protein